jgi:hypothetical protein
MAGMAKRLVSTEIFILFYFTSLIFIFIIFLYYSSFLFASTRPTDEEGEADNLADGKGDEMSG